MRLELPFWYWFIYFDVKFWFVTMPAAIILMLAGWYGAPWLGGARWATFALAAVLAIPFPLAGAFVIYGEVRAAAALAAVTRKLDREETVAGMTLPPGARISFRDNAHLRVASIALPRPASIWGMELTGTLDWNDVIQTWSATLAKNQNASGWPCRAGLVEFDGEGIIQECDLFEAHRLLGYTLPRGTHVSRGNGTKPWAFRLPPDGELEVPVLGARAPAGVTLYVSHDGRLERINSGHGQTITVHGVPLNSMNFYLRDGKAVAALAEAYRAGDELLPKGTGVAIDLASGTITPVPKNWWLTKP
jgi:hypothetical protein